jgi:PAS domain S-box-containing protein
MMGRATGGAAGEARALRILHLEDSALDAELVREALQDSGWAVSLDWASNKADFIAGLRRGGYDLVLADYLLPDYDAPAALSSTASLCPGLPFICVSGAIGEEKAVELLRQGATDYVSKLGLEKLPMVIRRALDEVEEQKARTLAELELHKSEDRYGTILKTAMDGFWLVDTDGRLLEVNETYARMSGYSGRELKTMRIPDLEDLETAEAAAQHMRKIMELGEDRFESRHRRKDGSVFDVEVSVQFRNVDGGWFICFFRDITERKRAELLVRQALREKEILLKELFHRTRNNMQVIIALLSIAGGTAKNATVSRIVQDMSDRILSMSLVHKKLYESQDLSQIDLKEYAEELLHVLFEGELEKRRGIVIALGAEPMTLVIDRAVPFGLVLHELVLNSLRHAFPDRGVGRIAVHIARNGEGSIELVVSDDGVGPPEGFDGARPETFGLQLVRGLVEGQMGGSLSFETGRGLTCRVRFSDAKSLKRI